MQSIVASRIRALRRRLLIGALVAWTPGFVAAQQTITPPAEPQPGNTTSRADSVPGSGMTVTLLTFGPGATIEDVWGHDGIWVRDPTSGLDRVYHWGVYNFEDPGFVLRLAKGTMMYAMGSESSEDMLRAFAYYNRDIFAQELNLTPAQKVALLERVRINDTDENRHYRYQYYLDNCSTRARDALDAVLGGRIAAALDTVPARVTWRWHARRLLRTIPWAYVGMEFALGNPADELITAHDEGFLPMLLMKHLRRVTILDETGSEVPLVASETQLFHANRPPEPQAPPFALPWFVAAGVVMALALALAGRAWARVGAAVASFWSFLVGAAGLLLLLAWMFTDHTFWYRNENLLQASPLSLLLALLLLAGHLRQRWAARALTPVALAVLGLSLLGLLVQALPGFDQSNGEIIAFALPVHAAVAWLALRLPEEGAGLRRG